jgi:deazaflavin-dependent oxidoreductase (nitroreductase family)
VTEAGATAPGIPGWLRRLYAAPDHLYAAGLGRVFGHRLLRLTHVGRRSGQVHHTVLEVVRYDGATGEATVVAAYGPSADWVRNVRAGGRVEVDLGHGPRPAAYRVVGVDEAVEVYAEYERRRRLVRPLLRRTMAYFLGWPFDGSPGAVRRLAEQLPMLAFRPATTDGRGGRVRGGQE